MEEISTIFETKMELYTIQNKVGGHFYPYYLILGDHKSYQYNLGLYSEPTFSDNGHNNLMLFTYGINKYLILDPGTFNEEIFRIQPDKKVYKIDNGLGEWEIVCGKPKLVNDSLVYNIEVGTQDMENVCGSGILGSRTEKKKVKIDQQTLREILNTQE